MGLERGGITGGGLYNLTNVAVDVIDNFERGNINNYSGYTNDFNVREDEIATSGDYVLVNDTDNFSDDTTTDEFPDGVPPTSGHAIKADVRVDNVSDYMFPGFFFGSSSEAFGGYIRGSAGAVSSGEFNGGSFGGREDHNATITTDEWLVLEFRWYEDGNVEFWDCYEKDSGDSIMDVNTEPVRTESGLSEPANPVLGLVGRGSSGDTYYDNIRKTQL